MHKRYCGIVRISMMYLCMQQTLNLVDVLILTGTNEGTYVAWHALLVGGK